MNRDPSTSVLYTRKEVSAGVVRACGAPINPAARAAMAALFAAQKEAWPDKPMGIARIGKGRVWFVVQGDHTQYSLAATPEEIAHLF